MTKQKRNEKIIWESKMKKRFGQKRRNGKENLMETEEMKKREKIR